MKRKIDYLEEKANQIQSINNIYFNIFLHDRREEEKMLRERKLELIKFQNKIKKKQKEYEENKPWLKFISEEENNKKEKPIEGYKELNKHEIIENHQKRKIFRNLSQSEILNNNNRNKRINKFDFLDNYYYINKFPIKSNVCYDLEYPQRKFIFVNEFESENNKNKYDKYYNDRTYEILYGN